MNVPLLLIVVIAPILYSFVSYVLRPYRSPLRRLPGPPASHWLYGTFSPLTLKTSRMTHAMADLVTEYGSVFTGYSVSRKRWVLLGDLKAAEYVLLNSSTKYIKSPTSIRVMRMFFGESLLGVNGEAHRRHRKVALPAFTQASVNELVPSFHEAGRALVARWDGLIQQSHPSQAAGGQAPPPILINAFSEFTSAALDVIGLAGFGFRFHAVKGESTELQAAFDKIFSLLVTGSLYSIVRGNFSSNWIQRIGSLFVAEQRELDEARRVVNSTAAQLVDRAKREAWQANLGQKVDKDSFSKDLLSLLVRSNMSADLKESEKMSDTEVIDMVPTFLSAGHETTSTSLSWCAYALTQPGHGSEVQARLRAELNSHPGWDADSSSIDSLPYLDAVTREVMRLYCPVRMNRRRATADDVIHLGSPIRLRDGTVTQTMQLRKGDDIYIPIFHLNTAAEIWGPDAKSFVPERWLDEGHEFHNGGLATAASNVKHGWSHMHTFSLGTRRCIGMGMAVLEFKVLVAHMILNFQLHLPNTATEAPIPIDYRQAVVARPVVLGQEQEGFQLPIRISRI